MPPADPSRPAADPSGPAVRAARDDAGVALQIIQDLAGRAVRDDARVRFPRGWLRTAAEARALFPSVRTPVLVRNLAYAVQLADIYGWLLERTDLAGIVRDMVIKAYVACVAGIAEAVLADHFAGETGWRQHFASRTRMLRDRGAIDGALADELLWLWDVRNKQHVHEIDASEFDAYTPEDYPRARAAVAALLGGLAIHAGHPRPVRPL